MQPSSHFSHDKIKCKLDDWEWGDYEPEVMGHELVDIIQDPRTRWDSRTSNWPVGSEAWMAHCQKWKNCNYGYDWNVYLTYYEEKEDWFWEFSLIPPFQKDNLQARYDKGLVRGVEFVFRATRDDSNRVTGFHCRDISSEMDLQSSFSSKLADAYCFQPDGHKAISFEKLFEFMELCRSWHGSPDLTIV